MSMVNRYVDAIRDSIAELKYLDVRQVTKHIKSLSKNFEEFYKMYCETFNKHKEVNMADEFGIKGTGEKPTTPRPNINMSEEKLCKVCLGVLTDRGNGPFCCNESCQKYREVKPTHDSVEVCFVLIVKVNVDKDHEHNINEDFIRGLMQADDSPNHVGDKAIDRVTGVFETAGMNVEDNDCMATIAGVKVKPITVDEEVLLDEGVPEDDEDANSDEARPYRWMCEVNGCESMKQNVKDLFCKVCLEKQVEEKESEHDPTTHA